MGQDNRDTMTFRIDKNDNDRTVFVTPNGEIAIVMHNEELHISCDGRMIVRPWSSNAIIVSMESYFGNT